MSARKDMAPGGAPFNAKIRRQDSVEMGARANGGPEMLSVSAQRAEQIRRHEEEGTWKDENFEQACLHDGDKTAESLPSETDAKIECYISSFALHHAAVSGSHGLVRWLIKTFKGEARFEEFITGVDYKGWTALHYACQNGHLEVAELLLEVDPPNHFPAQSTQARVTTPLRLAIQPFRLTPSENHIVSERECSDRAALVALILSSPKGRKMLNLKDSHGNTALHLAVETTNLEAVEILVQQPRLIATSPNDRGETPLHLVLDEENSTSLDMGIIKRALESLPDVHGACADARHLNAANALLVGGALLVAVTFQSHITVDNAAIGEWFHGPNNMSFYFAIMTTMAAIGLINCREEVLLCEREVARLRHRRMFTSIHLTVSTLYAIVAYILSARLQSGHERVSALSSMSCTSTWAGLFFFTFFILIPFVYEDLAAFRTYLNAKLLWFLGAGSKWRTPFSVVVTLVILLMAVSFMFFVPFGLAILLD